MMCLGTNHLSMKLALSLNILISRNKKKTTEKYEMLEVHVVSSSFESSPGEVYRRDPVG